MCVFCWCIKFVMAFYSRYFADLHDHEIQFNYTGWFTKKTCWEQDGHVVVGILSPGLAGVRGWFCFDGLLGRIGVFLVGILLMDGRNPAFTS